MSLPLKRFNQTKLVIWKNSREDFVILRRYPAPLRKLLTEPTRSPIPTRNETARAVAARLRSPNHAHAETFKILRERFGVFADGVFKSKETYKLQ